MACRPLLPVRSGVPAAAMFYEHLADADDAALRRLYSVAENLELRPVGLLNVVLCFTIFFFRRVSEGREFPF